MQCPSCEFQNMPGSGRCARCGASLALASATIDVIPPRAGRLQRRLPQFWGLRRVWANFLQSASRPLASTFSKFDDVRFDLGTMLRVVIPGWAHAYRGKRERGLLFLATYLLLLLPSLILLGTSLGSMLLGLAFGVHVMSAVDAMVGYFSDFAARVAFSLFASMGIFGLVYFPIGYLVSRVATPIQITQMVPGFEQGDVLWYNRSAQIRPGDLVYYEIPPMTINGRLADGHAVNYVFRDRWINRVAAVAGQTVEWRDGQLQVDGVPWELGGRAEFPSAFVVPANQVVIPPETLVPAGMQITAEQWRSLSVIPTSRIEGRVFFRSAPLWRISRVY